MKFACTARAATYLPPVPPTRARSAWKSAPTAIRSLPANRNWCTPPDAWSASAATILAPMAGGTDTVFRRFIRNASFVRKPGDIMSAPTDRAAAPEERSGCGLIMTEFTSADGLFRTREKKRKRYLHFYEDEHPISAQLFGSDPYTLSEAARIVESAAFDLVDLNLGCPAKRVVKCNGGSGRVEELAGIQHIFEGGCAAGGNSLPGKVFVGRGEDKQDRVKLARVGGG